MLCNIAPYLADDSDTLHFYIDASYAYIFLPADTPSDTQIEFVVQKTTPGSADAPASGTIDTVLGTNNIWADTGAVTVTYIADPALYIQKIIAEQSDVSPDQTANIQIPSLNNDVIQIPDLMQDIHEPESIQEPAVNNDPEIVEEQEDVSDPEELI